MHRRPTYAFVMCIIQTLVNVSVVSAGRVCCSGSVYGERADMQYLLLVSDMRASSVTQSCRKEFEFILIHHMEAAPSTGARHSAEIDYAHERDEVWTDAK